MFKVGDVVVATKNIGSYIQTGDDFDVLHVAPEIPGMEQEHISINICGRHLSLPSILFLSEKAWTDLGLTINIE